MIVMIAFLELAKPKQRVMMAHAMMTVLLAYLAFALTETSALQQNAPLTNIAMQQEEIANPRIL